MLSEVAPFLSSYLKFLYVVCVYLFYVKSLKSMKIKMFSPFLCPWSGYISVYLMQFFKVELIFKYLSYDFPTEKYSFPLAIFSRTHFDDVSLWVMKPVKRRLCQGEGI